LAFGLCLLVVPKLLPAQVPAASPSKIGIINIQEAIATTAEGKKALGDIQTKFRPRQQDLQRQQQELQAIQDQLQKGANTLSDEEQRRLNRDYEEKQKFFKRTADDADSDYRAEGQDVIQRIGKKMVPIISDYAQHNGYALVFDPAAAQVPVYFIDKGIDVTEEVIKRYDAANPVKAEQAADAPRAPAKPAATPAARPATTSAAKPAATKPTDTPKQ
jgi:outer membrane protein